MTTVDIHCHLATPSSRPPVDEYRRPENEPYDFYMGQDSRDHNKVMYPGIVDQLTNAAARLEDMDRMGVDVQGLATFVSEYHYWAPADLAAESARIQNDNVASVVAEYPDRFVALGPRSRFRMSTWRLARWTGRSTNWDSKVSRSEARSMGSTSTSPASARSGPRSRPRGSPSSSTRVAIRRDTELGSYFLTNCIGNPLETMVAATRMIFSGLFRRAPRIKLVLLHGGGYLPFYSSRADHTWKVRPDTRVAIPTIRRATT